MRIWVIAFALIAAAQPAFAKPGSRHAARAIEASRIAAPAAFARTDPTDTPYVLGEPAFPSRSRQSFAAPPASSFAGLGPALPVRLAGARNTALDGMIARHAAANGLPAELVHRVVIRESRYNPAARNGPNL